MKWSSQDWGSPRTLSGGGWILRTVLAPATDGLPASRFLAPRGQRASPTRSFCHSHSESANANN
ncbi:hypothetical protein SFR_2980 [Streptomyces sp. FR-008]|nr:hypothetical protein SFR_2980 [Streptomyces sp. FR-008]